MRCAPWLFQSLPQSKKTVLFRLIIMRSKQSAQACTSFCWVRRCCTHSCSSEHDLFYSFFIFFQCAAVKCKQDIESESSRLHFVADCRPHLPRSETLRYVWCIFGDTPIRMIRLTKADMAILHRPRCGQAMLRKIFAFQAKKSPRTTRTKPTSIDHSQWCTIQIWRPCLNDDMFASVSKAKSLKKNMCTRGCWMVLVTSLFHPGQRNSQPTWCQLCQLTDCHKECPFKHHSSVAPSKPRACFRIWHGCPEAWATRSPIFRLE